MQQILLTSKQENHNHRDKNLQCPQCYHYVTKPLDLTIYYAYLQQILARVLISTCYHQLFMVYVTCFYVNKTLCHNILDEKQILWTSKQENRSHTDKTCTVFPTLSFYHKPLDLPILKPQILARVLISTSYHQ